MQTRFLSNHLLLGTALLGFALCLTPSSATASANIVIINNDGAGEGFNDPTPAAPVGGNPGTTIGDQRLYAFQYAAGIWGATLDSAVDIHILANFDELSCTSTSAVLGSAGAVSIWSDFPGAPLPGTWYSAALANKLAGVDLDPTAAEIRARFNSKLGQTGCLDGVFWYYGFDGNHGNNIDLVTVLLHEFAHGLGFQQFASLSDGSMPLNLPDAYNRNLLDLTTAKTWDQMSNAERLASAKNGRRLAWKGREVTGAVPCALSRGTPVLKVNNSSAAGYYPVGVASFGPALSSPGVTGDLVVALDGTPPTGNACEPIVNNVSGKIAVVDRGICGFVVKVKYAQDAGAIGVIVVDNVAGSPPAGLGGSDATITIPSVRVTQSDGAILKAAIGAGTVNATIGVDLAVRAGADAQGRALMNATDPIQTGSSVSHWDPIAFPNQLMEPAINADLTHSISEPADLTVALMRDLGWFPAWGHTKYDLNGNGCVDQTDYNALIAAIRARSTDPKYDLNCDGKVDIADSRTLVLHFSRPGGLPCP